jgi:3-oxoacyl-[acyl-carrier protein] reductase
MRLVPRHVSPRHKEVLMNLEGKVALVAGGFDGVGAAVATRLAADGAQLALVGLPRNSSGPHSATTATSQDRLELFADIRSAADVDDQVHRVEQRWGRIDIAVITAGVHFETPAGATAPDSANTIIDTNVKGSWNIINAVVPSMKTRQSGKIVTLASGAGLIGFGRYALYSASKAAVIMMTRALSIELAPHGININCLAPGPTKTAMTEEIRTKPEHRGELDETLSRIRSRRGFSSADDMAGIVAFLVSDAASAMHGSCLLADEGYTAGM